MPRPKSTAEPTPLSQAAVKSALESATKAVVTRARKAPASAGADVAVKAPVKAPLKVSAVAPAKAKTKLVRDSFTIPKTEYTVLESLKQRAANLKRPVKKSELLRAGIGALNGMSDRAFLASLNAVPSLKTGRPGRE